MTVVRRVLALYLCFALVVFAEGNTFDRVRYNGGSVNSKVDPHDWHNLLVVSLLFGVSSTDPLTFVAVTLLLAFASLLASSIPALRATRVDPIALPRSP